MLCMVYLWPSDPGFFRTSHVGVEVLGTVNSIYVYNLTVEW